MDLIESGLEQEILRRQKTPRLLKYLILIWGRSGRDKLRIELDKRVREDENVAKCYECTR